MLAFARGCLEFLVVWLVAACGFYYVFESRFSPTGPLWGSVVAGFSVAAAWGLVRNAVIARGQAALIADSLAGAMPLADRPFAAIGKAVATESPLISPFQHRSCVLYSYELSEQKTVKYRSSSGSRTDRHKMVYFTGLAMTHWAVQTSNGPVAVCGFPVPDQFKEEVVNSSSAYSLFTTFSEQTHFERVGKWDVAKMLNFASIVLQESSGPVRQDLWFEEADEVVADPSAWLRCRLIEQLIAVDEPVCVIGKFDQQLGGLVNDFSHGGLQVLAGDAKQAVKHLNRTAASYLIFAVVSILVGLFAPYGVLTLREKNILANQPAVDVSKALLGAFEAEDWEKFSEQLKQGVSPDARDSVGRPLLLAAIAQRQSTAIDLLLAAGADVNAAQDGWQHRPLEAAFDRNQQELFHRLRELGATGVFADPVTGKALDSELPEIRELLSQYTRAQDQGDSTLMEQIADQWPQDYLESLGRGLYKDTRPVEWTSVTGYRCEDIATFVAEGRTKGGSFERYVMTVRKVDDKWKLRRDHFDDRLEFEFAPVVP